MTSYTLNGKRLTNFISIFWEVGIVTLKSSLKIPSTATAAVSSISSAGNLMLRKKSLIEFNHFVKTADCCAFEAKASEKLTQGLGSQLHHLSFSRSKGKRKWFWSLISILQFSSVLLAKPWSRRFRISLLSREYWKAMRGALPSKKCWRYAHFDSPSFEVGRLLSSWKEEAKFENQKNLKFSKICHSSKHF